MTDKAKQCQLSATDKYSILKFNALDQRLNEARKTTNTRVSPKTNEQTNGKRVGVTHRPALFVCLFVGCLTSQQHDSVSQGRICTDNFTCCHTEIEAADQVFHLTQSQYTDTGQTSPSADPITPGAGQGSHWSANFSVTGMTRPRKNPGASGIQTRDLLVSRRTPYH